MDFQESCTQESFNDINTNSYMSSDGSDDKEGSIWGLLRRKGDDKEFQLRRRNSPNNQRESNMYVIGRNPKNDIAVQDGRVSWEHCYIYCEYVDERLQMFVEDNSSHGTFINNSLNRLGKGEKAELKSGYEIFLLNPHFTPKGEVISFIFINMRERIGQFKKVDAQTRSNQNLIIARHIEDFYVIGDTIGSGMCGQVFVCTNIFTKELCAVKVIDVRRFKKTPGLSTSELLKEADMMKSLDHVRKNLLFTRFVSHVYLSLLCVHAE